VHNWSSGRPVETESATTIVIAAYNNLEFLLPAQSAEIVISMLKWPDTIY
jgi:hypothetical protein